MTKKVQNQEKTKTKLGTQWTKINKIRGKNSKKIKKEPNKETNDQKGTKRNKIKN